MALIEFVTFNKICHEWYQSLKIQRTMVSIILYQKLNNYILKHF